MIIALIIIFVVFILLMALFLIRDQEERYCDEPPHIDQDCCQICGRKKCKCSWPLKKMK